MKTLAREAFARACQLLLSEAWAQARLEWRRHLTLETLTQMRAFGRIG